MAGDMTPAERARLGALIAKVLDEALSNEALETPEEIATVIVYALLTEYQITPKTNGGN
jgi:hypothetical protein